MKLLTKSEVVFDKILDVLAWISGSMALFMGVAVSYSVVMRYVVNQPPIWVVQISEYLLLWMTFLGAPWLLRERGHVSIDIVINFLGRKAQRVLGIITSAIGAAVCLLIVWFGTETTWSCLQAKVMEAKVIYIPKAPCISIIAFAGMLLGIQFVRNIFRGLRSKV